MYGGPHGLKKDRRTVISRATSGIPGNPYAGEAFGVQLAKGDIEEVTKAGVMLDTAGLTPSAQGTRVRWEGGEISVTDGPFTEAKEVVGGYAIMQCKDMAEAIEWTKRFLKVHEEFWTVTREVREIAEG